MYRCERCEKVIGPKIPQVKVVIIRRTDGNIAKEIAVCPPCSKK